MMKKPNLMKKWFLFILYFFGLLGNALHAASITQVEFAPDPLTIDQPITITVSGNIGSLLIPIEDSVIFNDHLIQIDLTFDFSVVALPAAGSWIHSVNIGTLPAGFYDLTVRILGEPIPEFDDIFETSFEVIPEPASLLLLSLAGLKVLAKHPFHGRG